MEIVKKLLKITTKRKQVNISTFLNNKPVNKTENLNIMNLSTSRSSENELKTDCIIENSILEP